MDVLGGGLSHASHNAYVETFVTVLQTRYLAGELAQAHGVPVESILRAAVMDFARGRGRDAQAPDPEPSRSLTRHKGDKTSLEPNGLDLKLSPAQIVAEFCHIGLANELTQ